MTAARQRLATVAVVAASATALSATAASANGYGETIAHRGGNSATPESTFAAFGSALRTGVDGIEFDVQFTRDGVPVVMHDLRIDRTTNCRGAVRSVTWTKLRTCDAGGWFDEAFSGQRVPTLVQALRFVQRRSSSTKIYVHVRSPNARQAKTLVSTIRANGLTSRVTVLGSSRGQLNTMKRAGFSRLGYVFNTASGWHSNYPVLVPYNVTVTEALVRKAHRQGQKVYTVEGQPYSERTGRAFGVDGVLVNTVGGGSAATDGFSPAWW